MTKNRGIILWERDRCYEGHHLEVAVLLGEGKVHLEVEAALGLSEGSP